MVGRELKLDLESRRDAKPGEVVLSATGIKAPGVNDVSLDVRAGEIVGLGGLVGAGRTELIRAIIGADNKTAGNVTITIDGKKQQITSYMSAMRNGVAYVPEERRVDGLAMTMTVSDNIYLPNRKDLATSGITRSVFAHQRSSARLVSIRVETSKRLLFPNGFTKTQALWFWMSQQEVLTLEQRPRFTGW
jgi:ABC-type sugar transport system ATPase subunit